MRTPLIGVALGITLLASFAAGLPAAAVADAVIEPTYLPFTESDLSAHFAPISGKTAAKVADGHLYYYRNSAAAYAAFLAEHPLPAALPIREMKKRRQIERTSVSGWSRHSWRCTARKAGLQSPSS